MNFSIVLTVVLFITGILLVVKGGDYFVDAASWIAEVSGIPRLIIGATVVSIATTLPEMLVSVMAATEGKVDMSIGNAVGSVTANIGLIMAISLVFMPGIINRKDYLLKSLLMLLASVIIVCCGFFGSVSYFFSAVLIVIFGVFFAENYIAAKKGVSAAKAEERDKDLTKGKTVALNIFKFVIGAAGIVVGADLLVDKGSEIALILQVPERIIGVTMVAVGTSLPELITTVTAISKKQSELSVGNIIGANIMDLTLIMPLSSFISGKPLPISATAMMIDLPACLLVGTIALVPALLRKKFSRAQGFCLLAVYIAYVVLTSVVKT